MCGICGIYNEKNLPLVTSMLESIRHRGPDSFSTILFKNHSLGECGLNIVSTKEDQLPYIDRESQIALLFNGEIYNYLELKQNLTADGFVFTSESDSEVIIPLYKKYKHDFVHHLKGMFAIVLVDGDKIILARDRYGIKPLYYYQSGKKLVFGSEIKSLLQHPEVPAELDRESLEELIVFGYIFSEDKTMLKKIRQVSPGSLIIFDGRNISNYKYYQMPSSFYLDSGKENLKEISAKKNYEDCVEQLREVLTRTFTMMHKHGDSDKGIYLSGGIDSTAMAIFSREVSGRPVATYTIADSEEAPDLKYARLVSRNLETEHKEFFVTADDYLNELPRFVYHYENIMAGVVFDIQGGIAFHMLSRNISKYHKIAFTGEGADELFGGYYWIYTHPLGFSDRIRQQASRLIDGSNIKCLVDRIFPSPEDEKVYRKNLFDVLMKSGLANYHLCSVDRSCSAFGFEARPPYLYDEVAEFALSIPIDFKVPDANATKQVFKDAMKPPLKKYNLLEIAERKKYGMPAAISRIGLDVQTKINNIVPEKLISTHPFKEYLKNSIDILMFDLFQYFFIQKRGQYESGFSIEDFYKEKINEDMYHQ